MSASKEGNAGEVKLYRESPACYVVRVIDTPDTETEWHYELEILRVLEGIPSDRIGDKFTVSKNKEHGQMASWHLFSIDDPYTEGWLDGCGVDIGEFI